jgi:hypothetical protein
MRAINHLALDRQYACIGMCLEGGDDLFSMPDFILRRAEGRIDNRHLCGVDRELPREALTSRRFGLGPKSGLVPEVREHSIDRLNSRRDRAREAERARELVGEA